MTDKHMQEREITQNIKERHPKHIFFKYRAKDFIASKVDDSWKITFTFMEATGYELHIKRNGIKTYKTLNAVESCLRGMGVNEFKVVIIT